METWLVLDCLNRLAAIRHCALNGLNLKGKYYYRKIPKSAIQHKCQITPFFGLLWSCLLAGRVSVARS